VRPTVARVAVLPWLALAGCAQILGLDNTKFDQQDAPTDAPSICDGDPVSCTFGGGRTICGVIRGTGETAGQPLRVADPTGAQCQPGDTEGPCAFTVAGLPLASFLGGSTAGRVAATVDDCGRFVVLDLDAMEENVAVTLEASGYNATASLVIGRPPMPGTDRDVDGLAVSEATVTAWASQLGTAAPLDLTTGFLIRYSSSDAPTGPPPPVSTSVARGGGNALTNAIGTIPWASYFGGGARFGALDPALTGTAETGTALAVLGSGAGTYSVDGVRTGSRCRVMDLDQVTGTLIYVIGIGC
jgi:hypothetical protein